MDILSFLLGRITADGSGGGGSANLGTLLITENGQYDAADEGYDGYSEVSAEIPASAVDTGTKNITSNGDNQDVIGYAAVNVNVPNSYAAGDEGKVVSDGALVAQTAHADVTPGTSDQTIDTTLNNSIKVIGDADLVTGNIKKDVNIFGVTGTYEGGSGGVTLGPMDYPVSFVNHRSATVAFNRILYSATVMIAATNANVNANETATYNNLLTDGQHIWFRVSNITRIGYNGSDADFVMSGNAFMVTIPNGFDGTIPFDLYTS